MLFSPLFLFRKQVNLPLSFCMRFLSLRTLVIFFILLVGNFVFKVAYLKCLGVLVCLIVELLQ